MHIGRMASILSGRLVSYPAESRPLGCGKKAAQLCGELRAEFLEPFVGGMQFVMPQGRVRTKRSQQGTEVEDVRVLLLERYEDLVLESVQEQAYELELVGFVGKCLLHVAANPVAHLGDQKGDEPNVGDTELRWR